MRNIRYSIPLLLVLMLTSCSKRSGSPQEPVQLPPDQLAKLMDATGGPRKTAESPAFFLVTLNNQSEWFLTSLEIQLVKKAPPEVKGSMFIPVVPRTYRGSPFVFLIEKGDYGKVGAIPPKSSGLFYFNIGPLLSGEREAEKCEAESSFQPYEWSIVTANGYRI